MCALTQLQEAKERVIQLHDDDPNVLHQMFGYMYNAAYDDTAADMPPVLLNVRMIAIAEKYFVSHLATLAIDKLSHAADAAWETEAFADAICEAWATGANREVESRLRKTLLDVVVQHGKDPFDTEQSKYAYFQATAAETTGISKEVASVVTKELAKLREEMANPPRLRTYKCPGSESHGCRAAFRTLMEAGQGASYDCDMCGYGWTQDYEDWQEFRIIMQEVQTCKHSSDVG